MSDLNACIGIYFTYMNTCISQKLKVMSENSYVKSALKN